MTDGGFTRQLSSAEETERLGRRLGSRLNGSAVVFLEGELGAGKTTFCRGVLMARGHTGAVKSPTYTLVEPYELSSGAVYHFDLYRLGNPEELDFIGIRDYCDAGALILVEWPGRGVGMLPEPDLWVRLTHAGGGREVNIRPTSAESEAFLRNL